MSTRIIVSLSVPPESPAFGLIQFWKQSGEVVSQRIVNCLNTMESWERHKQGFERKVKHQEEEIDNLRKALNYYKIKAGDFGSHQTDDVNTK